MATDEVGVNARVGASVGAGTAVSVRVGAACGSVAVGGTDVGTGVGVSAARLQDVVNNAIIISNRKERGFINYLLQKLIYGTPQREFFFLLCNNGGYRGLLQGKFTG
jgi:hypothetical protein